MSWYLKQKFQLAGIGVSLLCLIPGFLRAQVDTAWVRQYKGPLNSDNQAKAIAVDGSGNVYVTGQVRVAAADGFNYATIKYNSRGVKQWSAQYNGSENVHYAAYSIAVDGSGNVYVCGQGPTIKYNSAGQQQWVTPDSVYSTALFVDVSGNVYATAPGYTIKYNTAGKQQWRVPYGGAIAVDNSGNVYVTGSSIVSGTGIYATIKYNSAGEQQWLATQAGNIDRPGVIAVDGKGNVYVAGYGSGFVTTKYNSAGQEQWVSRYSAGNGFDMLTAFTVDNSGNVYVTGTSRGSGTDWDYATIKYNPAGQQQWVARYDCSGGQDMATALAVDGSGNVYVTGKIELGPGPGPGPGPGTHYATIKYNSSGAQKWIARYNGPGSGGDTPTAIAVDGSGNVYVTGGIGTAYVTIKYVQIK